MANSRALRLTKLREHVDMTLREVGDAIGKSHQTVHRYESDDAAGIRRTVLLKLAELYKTTPEYIETGQHPKPPVPGPHDTVAFVNMDELEFIELPFIVPAAYGSFINSCHEKNYGDFDTVRIIKQPGTDYKGAVVVEIRGNSMAPRYPERSCHVVRPVSDGNWQHALGVHAISLRSEMFLIKRIVSNLNGVLKLRSDANQEEMEIQLGDINCMWKVGESSYMPAED